MTWELLVLFGILGVGVGAAWAYTRRKNSPYNKSLSQQVREGSNPPDEGAP
jgi:hypothetical protein